MAEENHNNYLAPEHLLYALIDQDGGLIPTLLGRMGVDCNELLGELNTAIDALPKVGGSSTQSILRRNPTVPSTPPKRRQRAWAMSMSPSSI